MKIEKVCTNCGSNATRGMKEDLFAVGGGFILLGGILCVFIITAIIGIPLIVVGALTMIVSKFITNKKWTCKNCKTTFQ